MSKNNTLPEPIPLPDGWNAIIHDGMLFVLDQRKDDKCLSLNRTVFSLITAKPSLKKSTQSSFIYTHMTKVTKDRGLLSWTLIEKDKEEDKLRKDKREYKLKTIREARNRFIKSSTYGYQDMIRDWYNNQENESSGEALAKEQKISNAMLLNEVQKLKERVTKLEAIINK